MHNDRRLFRIAIGFALGMICMSNAAFCSAAAPPYRAQLQALMDKYLRRDPSYKPGDLLFRRDVGPIFDELVQAGLKPVDQGVELSGAFLPNSGFLAQLWKTPIGREFMRRAGALPNGYDRLERLSWLTTGRDWLQQMAESKDGIKMFEQLLTNEGTAAVEKQFADDPQGRDFRLPTGHIRTEQELLMRLERIMKTEIDRRQTAAQKAPDTKSPSTKSGKAHNHRA